MDKKLNKISSIDADFIINLIQSVYPLLKFTNNFIDHKLHWYFTYTSGNNYYKWFLVSNSFCFEHYKTKEDELVGRVFLETLDELIESINLVISERVEDE